MKGGVSPRMTSRYCDDHPQNSNFKHVNKDFDNPFQNVINSMKGKKNTHGNVRAWLYQFLWSWTRHTTLSPVSAENYSYNALIANGQNWPVKKPLIKWAFIIFMKWSLPNWFNGSHKIKSCTSYNSCLSVNLIQNACWCLHVHVQES